MKITEENILNRTCKREFDLFNKVMPAIMEAAETGTQAIITIGESVDSHLAKDLKEELHMKIFREVTDVAVKEIEENIGSSYNSVIDKLNEHLTDIPKSIERFVLCSNPTVGTIN